MSSYLLENQYIDIAVQKGGVPGISGCIEHTSVLTQIIRETRESKGELAVVWLDLANAYGTVPHKLVELTLERYHVPEKTRAVLKDYFDHLQLRFTVQDYTTAWQRLEIGKVTGCTISVILFSAAMNMIVKSVEKKSRVSWMKSGVRQPPGRAFMNDMTVTTKTVIEAKWTIQELESAITWARMKVKPSKSRSLVIKNGKVKEERFKIDGETIPTVSEEPVKCLGKFFNDTLTDRQNVKETCRQLNEWMKTLDKSGLPGKYKAWIYQHGILPRLLWPLLVYDVPLTIVEGMETIASRYLRRWLGVPRSFSSVGLYSSGTKLQLPLKSITEDFKETKVRQHLLLQNSKDERVRTAKVEIRTGRKWSVKETIEEAQSRLRISDIIGRQAIGRQGRDDTPTARWGTASVEEKQNLMRTIEEDSRMVKAAGMKKQGSWLNWENTRQVKLGWNDIWKMEPFRLQFKLKSVYDVLPSPTNLVTWGVTDDPKCALCSKSANLEHILSACSQALKDGRYTWRHDKVLASIADTLEKSIKKPRKNREGLRFVNFVKEGEKGHKVSVEGSGLLGTATDWQMREDLKKRLEFPPEITATNKRPDIVIWSVATKQTILMELKLPWEGRMEDAYERKNLKYQDLVTDCQQNGWKVWFFAVEVGCRGFVGQSMWRAPRVIGITGAERRRLIGSLCREAESASMWLWRRRAGKWKDS
ncbi:uncharacterized protein LOC133193994 [Saccostrea echinata]|uniref:uncharacterized protein LOC133193994 n=1 Tax=Saccostrea echinata TaxID=191078 RepID=UPI002A839631|nr:uncharacterized protein LOC133193994 [Saccostrea echinata]